MLVKMKVARAACLLAVLLTVAFIFYNSAQPVPDSIEASANVAEQIAAVVPVQDTAEDGTNFVQLVRKAAHAVEFFCAGCGAFRTVLSAAQKTAHPDALEYDFYGARHSCCG